MEIFIKIATAFLVGGAICFAVQIVIDKTALTPARILVFLVVGGVLLGAVGLYDKIYSFAGCGISVPLIGFGGNIAKTVRESVLSSGLSGIITAPVTAAAGGIGASLFFAFINALIFRGRPKRVSGKKKNPQPESF